MNSPPCASRFRVGVVESGERDALVSLREAAYAKSESFEWIDLARLGWTTMDDTGVVLGTWRQTSDNDSEQLVASFRLNRFVDRKSAEAFLEYSLAGVPDRFPALVPSRSATLPAVQRLGLHAIMRAAYLRALPGINVRSVLTVVFEGAPRVASMLSTGYESWECKAHWDSESKSRTRPLILSLPHHAFDQARQHCEGQVDRQKLDVRFDHVAIDAALRERWA